MTVYNEFNKNLDLNDFGLKNPLENMKLGVLKMKKKTEKAFKLSDGLYKGKIKSIEAVSPKGYDYVNIEIEESGSNLILRVGFPFNITKNTSLGRLIERFSGILRIDAECEIRDNKLLYDGKLILEKNDFVMFETATKETEKGTFANVLHHSIKPA